MMRQFLSTTIGQILTIIATSTAVTFLLFIALLYYPGAPPSPPWPWQAAYRITSIVEFLKVAPEDVRSVLAASVQRPYMSLRLTEVPVVCATRTLDTRNLEAVLISELPDVSEVTVRVCDSDDSPMRIQVLVPLGSHTLDFRTAKIGRPPPRLTFPFFGSALFLCVAVAGMSAWAVWRVIRPLRRLSEKADDFGRNISVSPIDEEGPLEIRRAARAFNLMQQRITRSMQDRTRMLAAISHDLRTPLTRMRLQLETGTGGARDKLLRDVSLMQSMVSSVLAFLSGSFDDEEEEWLDLGALLSTLCDEYEERGARVDYQGPEQIRFFCRPNAITRSLTNLVDNATRFGETVLISATATATAIMIDVSDNGPGIPKDRIQDVVEPFVRLDHSRSSHPGSVGLGLFIVKEIVESHGGTLELINKQPNGLIARIKFPGQQDVEVGL